MLAKLPICAPLLALVLATAACRSPAASEQDGSLATGSEGGASSGDAAPAECDALFGRPSPATGLTEAQCRPECPCLDGWVAPTYDAAAIASLRAWVLIDPPAELDADPYATPDGFVEQPDKVCGVLVDGDAYTLATFDGEAQARAAGAVVTHAGACGLCSPLSDLAVYIEQPDLTEPVRACGVLGLTQGDAANLQCLLDLGFSLPCAQIWFFNTDHTRAECFDECIAALEQPYHLPDGSLNPCLSCDEERSGPVFKAVAGRTRRNTGLASALCRPCDTVQRIVTSTSENAAPRPPTRARAVSLDAAGPIAYLHVPENETLRPGSSVGRAVD